MDMFDMQQFGENALPNSYNEDKTSSKYLK